MQPGLQSERLFPESQWRAIADVERRTEDLWERERALYEKPLMGGAFACGEFFISGRPEYQFRTEFGPSKWEFIVYERTSNLVFCYPTTKLEAISAARARIAAIGPEYLAEMMAESAKELAEERAEEFAREQARLAALEAKAARKVKKLSKRAKAVFEASDGKCHYCHTTLEVGGKWEIEHKVPRALFGGSEQSNLTAACVPCNRAKRDKTDLEFKAFLAAKNFSSSQPDANCPESDLAAGR